MFDQLHAEDFCNRLLPPLDPVESRKIYELSFIRL